MADVGNWNTRYDRDDYLFGTRPADFLIRHSDRLVEGARALAVADGEGRNSVYLAEQGLDVVAMDASDNGIAKARRLAAERGVTVDFRLADIYAWDWGAEQFDVVVAIFIQFTPPEKRPAIFEGLKAALKPGGMLMLHGYTPEQVDLGTGGPPLKSHMYTLDMLRDAFGDLDILLLEAFEAEVDEGEGHSGRSALIDLIARKPA